MSRTVRHYFACLLLVLLPFQALAGSFMTAKVPVPCAKMMMDGGDCCDDDGAVCADASACIAHAAIALPAHAAPHGHLAIVRAVSISVPSLHESYIPEALQRPPQALA